MGCTANAATAPTAPSATDFRGTSHARRWHPLGAIRGGIRSPPREATGATRLSARAFCAPTRKDAMDLERAPPTLRAGAMPWKIGGTRKARVSRWHRLGGYRNPKTLRSEI